MSNEWKLTTIALGPTTAISPFCRSLVSSYFIYHKMSRENKANIGTFAELGTTLSN